MKHLSLLERGMDSSVELIIINNNSSDATVQVAEHIWYNLGEPYPLSIYDEREPGISKARRKGVLKAKYPYILFCDDDNWLEADYLTRSIFLIRNYPEVGIFGGFGKPEFETDPPFWFDKYAHSYAVGRQAQKSGVQEKWKTVYGAGMILKKNVLLTMYQNGFESLLSGRKGDSLSSGEDNEICLWYSYLGMKILFDEGLNFKHLVPSDRMTKSYYFKRAAEKGKVEGIFKIYKNTLKGKKNRFLHNIFIWYKDIFKRVVLLFFYATGRDNFDKKVLKATLLASIKFRLNNRSNLFQIENRIR
ncbi:glycosyltransferase, partial [Fulvivirga lutimaris]|uniref:glycosyltransferase n=1 Tax=Fulvivirga lutimaris TaxID=1819566 RepID=UPI001FE30622